MPLRNYSLTHSFTVNFTSSQPLSGNCVTNCLAFQPSHSYRLLIKILSEYHCNKWTLNNIEPLHNFKGLTISQITLSFSQWELSSVSRSDCSNVSPQTGSRAPSVMLTDGKLSESDLSSDCRNSCKPTEQQSDSLACNVINITSTTVITLYDCDYQSTKLRL